MLFPAESHTELFCFSYKPNVDEEERRQDFVDVRADYSRMGLPDSLWKLSPINQHYKVSDLTSTAICVRFYPNMDISVAQNVLLHFFR